MLRDAHRIRIPVLVGSGLLVPILLVCLMFGLAPAGNATPRTAHLLTAACPLDPLSIGSSAGAAGVVAAGSPPRAGDESSAPPVLFPDPARIIGYSDDQPPQPGVRDQSGQGRTCSCPRETR